MKVSFYIDHPDDFALVADLQRELVARHQARLGEQMRKIGAAPALGAPYAAPAAPEPSTFAQDIGLATTKPQLVVDEAPAAEPDPVFEPAVAGPVTREALVERIRSYHRRHGVPAALALLNKYGATRASEVKDEDIARLFAELAA